MCMKNIGILFIGNLIYCLLLSFRSCFPFACPKSDLAVTLKLFCSVTDVMLSEEGATDDSHGHSVVEQVDNLLRKAALHSYQDLLHLLSTEDDNRQYF